MAQCEAQEKSWGWDRGGRSLLRSIQKLRWSPSLTVRPDCKMRVLVPRVRTLAVRLSEDEYSALERFCLESGARSISHIARTAICNVVNQKTHENTLSLAGSVDARQLKQLQEKVDRICADIEFLKQGRPSEEVTPRQT